MPNSSSHHEKNQKNTSSGQGSEGMGGQPSDDPRDLARGGDGRSYDDEAGKDAVPGAFGSVGGAQADALKANSQATGQVGGPALVGEIDAALKKSDPVDPA